MLTIKDCMDYLDVSEEVVAEVAHHDHIPMICALEECSQLLQKTNGFRLIQSIILDNIVEAHEQNDTEREHSCMLTYAQFIIKHIHD